MTARTAYQLHKRLAWIESGRFIVPFGVVLLALLVAKGCQA